jgi:hypothetical protein
MLLQNQEIVEEIVIQGTNQDHRKRGLVSFVMRRTKKSAHLSILLPSGYHDNHEKKYTVLLKKLPQREEYVFCF